MRVHLLILLWVSTTGSERLAFGTVTKLDEGSPASTAVSTLIQLVVRLLANANQSHYLDGGYSPANTSRWVSTHSSLVRLLAFGTVTKLDEGSPANTAVSIHHQVVRD